MKKKKKTEKEELTQRIKEGLKTEKGRKQIAKIIRKNIKSALKIIAEDDINVKWDGRIGKYLDNFEEVIFLVLTIATSDDIELKEISNRFELLDLD